jgi:hypothetical protein
MNKNTLEYYKIYNWGKVYIASIAGTNVDTDHDGLMDDYETNGYYLNGFGSTRVWPNPLLTDTDGDGFNDGAEINHVPVTNPLDANDHP